MSTFNGIARLIRQPPFLLCLAALILYVLQIITWDCHFCFYFRTPIGVTSLLLPATLVLWLRYPGYILAMALSFLALGLAVTNVIKQPMFAMDDYGPDRWIQPAFMRSWGYLLVICLSVVIIWYALVSLLRRTPKVEI
jgi:ABC-type uncharacterized transport system permease subunit